MENWMCQTGVSGAMQAEEAGCSSDSDLSQPQMGQLEDDEKLWVQGPELCLRAWLRVLEAGEHLHSNLKWDKDKGKSLKRRLDWEK